MRMSNRTAIIFLCTLLLVLSACGGTPAPTQTPFIIVITAGPTSSGVGVGVGAGVPTPTPVAPASVPTTAPTSTTPPTLPPPSPTSAPVKLSTYSGSAAPFTVQYPADWTATDQEQDQRLVVIVSPDQLSALLVTYGPAGTLSAEQALETFLNNFNVASLKATNQKKNADGSMAVDLEYNDSSGNPVRALLRLVRQSTSANFYVLIFSTTPEKFAKARALGMTLLGSFQERPSLVRQSTPPVIARPTNTETPIPTPTDTPEPPPTSAPRPPAALFRLDMQARGYESWGAPKDGCNSGATGQWDNNHPIKRLTIDITLMNDSSRPIQESDIAAGIGMFSDTGVELLICKVSDIPTAAAHGSSSFGLTTFVEKNQFLSALRMTIFGSTVRVCFGRNNPPSVVGCG